MYRAMLLYMLQHLKHIRRCAYHDTSPFQLAFVKEQDITYLRIFGCAVYVSILPKTKMGPQMSLGYMWVLKDKKL